MIERQPFRLVCSCGARLEIPKDTEHVVKWGDGVRLTDWARDLTARWFAQHVEHGDLQ
jgi:hypothetical protein